MSPTYALTMGDPTGIGPEITLKALAELAHRPPPPYRLKVYGDIAGLAFAWPALWAQAEQLAWVQWVSVVQSNRLLPGQVSYAAIEQAVADIAANRACGLLTGPISKEALQQAGYPYPGHTELLEALANRWWPTTTKGHLPHQAEMLFLFNRFRLMLLTRHVPLDQVSQAFEPATIERALTSLAQFLHNQAGLSHPRVVMMGLNPHAGEVGGHEERAILIPVLERLAQGVPTVQWVGPVAADGLFRGFDGANPAYDAYVACYHDQGLIPMKLVGGWATVNVTIGLPFIRTSVSHGTAPDIAGQGIAQCDSMLAALATLHELVSRDE
jgi:4-hydroxythreonine-4-phosphate dehydrogenase